MSAPQQVREREEFQQPSNDEIANRAYLIYQHRTQTGQAGTPEQDWYQAIGQLTLTAERPL